MKRKALNITSLLLLVVLFTATTGFNLYSHLCTSSGSKDVSISKVESCCAQSNESSDVYIEKESCCELDNQLIKLEITTTNQKVINLVPDILPVAIFLLENISLQQISVNHSHNTKDLPPPKIGRDILLANQVFRI